MQALTEPLHGDMGLAAAIACGWRADLPESVYRQFQVSGLAHVVAVSGAHLSIVAALMASILGALRVPKPISVAAQIMLFAAYLALTAMPASAIRATLMTLAGMTSWTARRRASSLSALGCCIAVMIALDAQAALSSSFALSVLATLGIVVFGGLANS
ncbi:MAG: ComEC/Rec2 family competence protein, partial [Senegalimassilia sp.]|nr:ComEC/Rec2 family competence protein [Senegalimassilia sp.]